MTAVIIMTALITLSALVALIVVLRGASPEQRAVLLLAIAAVIRAWRSGKGHAGRLRRIATMTDELNM